MLSFIGVQNIIAVKINVLVLNPSVFQKMVETLRFQVYQNWKMQGLD